MDPNYQVMSCGMRMEAVSTWHSRLSTCQSNFQRITIVFSCLEAEDLANPHTPLDNFKEAMHSNRVGGELMMCLRITILFGRA